MQEREREREAISFLEGVEKTWEPEDEAKDEVPRVDFCLLNDRVVWTDNNATQVHNIFYCFPKSLSENTANTNVMMSQYLNDHSHILCTL